MQKRIADLLEDLFSPSSRATGYIKERGVKYNATLHLGKRLILNLDLKDFFPSINFGRIQGRLMAAPYKLNPAIATTIARLCTLDGKLPIGAPSSPILSNMICSHLDGLLTKIAREHGCFYSRYADDITFSTNRRSMPQSLVKLDEKSGRHVCGPQIKKAVIEAGFEVNEAKTRVLDRASRQEITGIVINEFPNVPRSFIREVRGALNAWEKYGLEAAEETFHERYNWRGSLSFETHLRGRIAHIIHVRGNDDLTVWRLVQRFNGLNERSASEIQYARPQNERDRLTASACRIETGDDTKMEYRQGTGIRLPNGLVLTNHHNLDIDGEIAPDIGVFLDDSSQTPIPMNVVRYDAAKDVALLEPQDEDWKAVIASTSSELSFSNTAIGDRVKVAGYPSYFVGDSCQLPPAEVVAFSKLEGIQYFRISGTIVKGNSGGPVFNSSGQVIGIASRGIDTHEVTNAAFNGCLELFRIEKFLKA
tara:strand:- start:197 stop:1630 length:1434 start_codon:yes stop_codon:yes gene_type:complete